MRVGGGRHLTYCSNIHAGESWPEVDGAIRGALPRIRTLLGHEGPLALGLRLSAEAASGLAQPDALAAFRAFLAEGGFYVPTINGFPYGAFHGRRVKERVYLPDWRDPARVTYSNTLADLLAVFVADAGLPLGSVSTVPGAFRTEITSDAGRQAVAASILRHVAHLVRLRERTGATVALALEPEPACLLESIRDAVAFFDAWLFNPALGSTVGDEERVTLDRETIRRHVGVCLDACHMAVEFEDPADGLAALDRAGIDVLKVQVSSALSLSGQTPAELATALAPFVDETYLHQVVERHHGAFRRYVDLPDGLAAAGGQADQSARDWRVHFHVPIFLERLQGFETTQPYLAALLAQTRAKTPCTCYEVETYTWDVLPAEYRTVDICTAIARELTWAREHLR
ncbi:MAG: metabolite traffic protein EboE [Vicinamibacterales bacterium]